MPLAALACPGDSAGHRRDVRGSTVTPILSRSQIQRPRTPAALLSWVETKGAKLGSSRRAKAYARSGRELPKKYFEEIRPLALFAKRRYGDRSDVRITPNLDNDNFDAVVSIPGEEDGYIEITYAKDGYDESLRLDVLTKEGSVNWLAPITITRQKGGARQITVANEMVDHKDVVRRNLSLVEDRLRGKANVVYGKRHTLIVVVDDYIPFRDSCDVVALEKLVRRKLRVLPLDFREMIILGSSGRLMLPYANSTQRSNNALSAKRLANVSLAKSRV